MWVKQIKKLKDLQIYYKVIELKYASIYFPDIKILKINLNYRFYIFLISIFHSSRAHSAIKANLIRLSLLVSLFFMIFLEHSAVDHSVNQTHLYFYHCLSCSTKIIQFQSGEVKNLSQFSQQLRSPSHPHSLPATVCLSNLKLKPPDRE